MVFVFKIMDYVFNKFSSFFNRLKEEIGKRKDKKEKIRKWKNKPKHIARLSPIYPEDYNDEEYYVYSNYLKKAFCDPSIRNIAITGNYGVGKSSFLKKWSKKKKYLFVSLCSFSGESSKDLECDLLQQLLLGCGYVAKNNNRIEKEWPLWKKGVVFFGGLCVSATIYFLHFFDVFKPIFSKTIKPFKPSLNKLIAYFYSKFPCLNELNLSIDTIKGIVYGLFSICMIIGLSIVILIIIKHYRLTKISFKLQNTEIQSEHKENIKASYMDCYRLDLVYALRQSAKKFDYTVIFEDMDRLKLIDCRSLFTELREINRLVNLHKSKKPLRFIYVIHDAVFGDEDESEKDQGQLMHLKFFDYILPIVPSLIDKSSANYVKESFRKIGFNDPKFIDIIAVYLSDYRLINNITNEYAILKDVYLARKQTTKLSEDEEKQLMALVIYKVLLPLDYKKIREGKSVIYPVYPNQITIIQDKAIQSLDEMGWLSTTCLKFVGYDISEIRKYIAEFFSADAYIDERNHQVRRQLLQVHFTSCSEIIISNLKRGENIAACLSSVCYTMLHSLISEAIKNPKSINFDERLISEILESKVQIVPSEEFGDTHKEKLKEFMGTLVDNDDSIHKLQLVIQYLLKINHGDFNWFFTVSVTDSDKKVPLYGLRWKAICKLDVTSLQNFISITKVPLTVWLNSFDNLLIPQNWRTYCSDETARELLKLPQLKYTIRCWLNKNTSTI